MSKMIIILSVLLFVLIIIVVLLLNIMAAMLDCFDNGIFCETNCPYKGDCKPLGANRFNFHEKN